MARRKTLTACVSGQSQRSRKARLLVHFFQGSENADKSDTSLSNLSIQQSYSPQELRKPVNIHLSPMCHFVTMFSHIGRNRFRELGANISSAKQKWQSLDDSSDIGLYTRMSFFGHLVTNRMESDNHIFADVTLENQTTSFSFAQILKFRTFHNFSKNLRFCKENYPNTLRAVRRSEIVIGNLFNDNVLRKPTNRGLLCRRDARVRRRRPDREPG
jgi:hypothetical protein